MLVKINRGAKPVLMIDVFEISDCHTFSEIKEILNVVLYANMLYCIVLCMLILPAENRKSLEL